MYAFTSCFGGGVGGVLGVFEARAYKRLEVSSIGGRIGLSK